MSGRLLFGVFAIVFALGGAACSGDKVQTPTSDKNYDDEGDPGSTNDPGGAKDGGARDADAAPATDAAPEATAMDAAPEAAHD
jgi:hypothetical protein